LLIFEVAAKIFNSIGLRLPEVDGDEWSVEAGSASSSRKIFLFIKSSFGTSGNAGKLALKIPFMYSALSNADAHNVRNLFLIASSLASFA
jgi:hypothetical protein